MDLDRYVIERAIDLVAADRSNTQFHLNLSGRSVCEPRLLDFVDNLVRSHHADPRRLTFEITETALISNMTAARRFADGLRQMQCQLALDDFGSGYASLAHLKYLPFDVVKIDGDLISGILDNAADKIMVRSLANMCSQLGIRTVAEFVSDEQTLAALSSYGVDFAQGFAVGRPVPTAEIEFPTSKPSETYGPPEQSRRGTRRPPAASLTSQVSAGLAEDASEAPCQGGNHHRGRDEV